MKGILFLLCSVLGPALYGDLTVHEWGSIHLVTGQNRAYVGDIADDQSDLPPFVDVWTRQPQMRPRVIEKPILYFYTKEKMAVTVTAGYPEGVFTQWWPKPVKYFPRFPEGNIPPPRKGGSITWNFHLDPTGGSDAQLPEMAGHPWWSIARDVDASTVVSHINGGTEKFLFYRGAGVFDPRLEVTVDQDRSFQLRGKEGAVVRDIYTIRVEEGKGPAFTYYPQLGSDPVQLRSSDAVADHMQERLEKKGLFTKEAAGMVKIWRKAMFEDPGFRAMYIMEREDVDKMLPLNIHPVPKQMERVFLVRFDILSPEMESDIRKWIRQLGAATYPERSAAKQKLLKTGRKGEAVMRSTLETTEDPEVKKSLREILKAITPHNPNP